MSSKIITADRIGGALWIAFGTAIVYGSWTMDRLSSLQIHPATAPGLVPGLLGISIVLLGMILVVRRTPSPIATFKSETETTASPEAAQETAPDGGLAWKRVLLSWTLCIVYGGVLLGRGAPYWLLTVAFLFLHINLIDETSDVPARLNARRAIIAAILATVFATAVMLIFERVFLVRLP